MGNFLAALFGIVMVIFFFMALYWKNKFFRAEGRIGELNKTLNYMNSLRPLFLDQERVDAVLTRLAIEFNEACLQEVHRQQFKSFEEYDVAFCKIRNDVRVKKNAFWDAHQVASYYSYRVDSKYGDYLKAHEPYSV